MLPLLSALTCARESRTLITLSPDMGMVLNHQWEWFFGDDCAFNEEQIGGEI